LAKSGRTSAHRTQGFADRLVPPEDAVEQLGRDHAGIRIGP
jgi:hypothetical protein